jgi:hypothetical protein
LGQRDAVGVRVRRQVSVPIVHHAKFDHVETLSTELVSLHFDGD